MKTASLLVALFIIAGCASGPPKARQAADGDKVGHVKAGASGSLRIGMPKDELISQFGPPESVAAESGKEVLYYTEEFPWWNWKPLRVTLIDGKIAEFGPVQK